MDSFENIIRDQFENSSRDSQSKSFGNFSRNRFRIFYRGLFRNSSNAFFLVFLVVSTKNLVKIILEIRPNISSRSPLHICPYFKKFNIEFLLEFSFQCLFSLYNLWLKTVQCLLFHHRDHNPIIPKQASDLTVLPDGTVPVFEETLALFECFLSNAKKNFQQKFRRNSWGNGEFQTEI